MSKLLLDEHPLMVMPKLAKEIGLNEAIILQQIHYWNEINKKTNNNFKDGYYWTFNSYDGWCEQFPFWSEHTIRRTIKNLEKMQLIIVGNYNKLKIDRTKWYRIDYKKLDKWDNSQYGQNGQTNIAEWPDQQAKMDRPLPETTPETTPEITLEINNHTSCESWVLSLFIDCFESYFNYSHRRINKIPDLTDMECFEYDDLKECFNEYFNKYSVGIKKNDLEKCSINRVAAIFKRYSSSGEYGWK